jgi:mitogen-activated protein kinase kinase kinase
MEKVLRKADKAGSSRRTDVMNRVETDDGGLSVDGWSVYLEWDEINDSGVISACLSSYEKEKV